MISAHALDDAVARHTPLARVAPPPELDEAYRVQQDFVAARSARTRSPIAGHKIAFTSAAAQTSVKTGGYASGTLLASDIVPSGSTVRLRDRFTPILEVELLFRAVEDLTPDLGIEELLARTEIAAGLEIPESRFADWFGGEYPALTVGEVVSDDCLAGLVAAGDRWTPASEIDLADARATLHHNGQLVRTGSVSLVVPGPVHALAWLVRQLADRGETLSAGRVVSSGTWTDTIALDPGRYIATFSGGIGDVMIEVVE